jgi:hypothetical protein
MKRQFSRKIKFINKIRAMRFVRKQTVAVVLLPLFNILRSQKIKNTSKILGFSRVAGVENK